MSMLRALLDTWENWSAHDVLSKAVRHAAEESPSALDALRDSAELIELLTGSQWQAMHAASADGATWEQIGAAVKTTGKQARAGYLAVVDRQEVVLGRDVRAYREVL